MSRTKDEVDELFSGMEEALERGAAAEGKRWKSLDSRDRALLTACDTGTVQEVQNLLKEGANPNIAFSFGNPLTLAIRSEKHSIEKISELVRSPMNVELTEDPGLTPLAVAASNNRPDVIRLLLNNGAQVNSQNHPMQWTALMGAACMGCENAAVELLAQGATLSLASEHGLTAIDIARANGKEHILRLFLKAMEKMIKT